MSNYTPLGKFMVKRHSIYLDKEVYVKPWPWTSDPILRKYSFCNVFRELDRVTVWIRKNIREPFSNHPNLLTMLALARQINRPETLHELIVTGSFPDAPGWTPERTTKILLNRQARKEKIYTGAYMIRAENNDGKKPWSGWPKVRYTSEVVVGRIYERQSELLSVSSRPLATQRALFDKIRYDDWFYGWGPFMTYELVTDLTWTHILRHAIDLDTWANPGPGAIRGLNRLHDRPLRSHPPYDQLIGEMREALESISQDIWPDNFPKLRMREIEHSLCEFDKYERVRFGQGAPKRHYKPGGVL